MIQHLMLITDENITFDNKEEKKEEATSGSTAKKGREEREKEALEGLKQIQIALEKDKASLNGEEEPISEPLDKNKIWKMKQGNDDIPEIAKKLRPSKKKQRIYYAYTYDNKTEEGGSAQDDARKVKVIRKRVERR